MYVQLFFAFLRATACSAITPALQTSAGLAGYSRRGLNPHLPLELSSIARGRCNVNRCGWGALTIGPRRRCTYGRPAIPAAGIEPTFLRVSHQKEAPRPLDHAGTEILGHCANALPHAVGNWAPWPLDCTGVVGLDLCAGAAHAQRECGFAVANRIPFGDHPLQ